MPPVKMLGAFDTSTLPKLPDKEIERAKEPDMTLDDCLNMDDIEKLATMKISRKAWAYYYSAGDDLISKTFNNTVYRSILLRPRIFVDVGKCDTSTTLLGHKVDLPIFVSPAAQARLAHDSGEHGIAQACASYGACQIISNNASQTPEEICANAAPGQIFGWQIYIQMDRKKSEAMLERINKIPSIKFIVLTLDAPVPGKRELDEREGKVGVVLPFPSAAQKAKDDLGKEWVAQAPEAGGGGVGKSLFAGTAYDLVSLQHICKITKYADIAQTWKATLAWLGERTKLPIVLKGVQTHEDAYMASLQPRVEAILLSNHGGRAADTAPPSIHTLLEIRKYCPEVLDRIEVWVDGGIKRGTDIVKALALGAKHVGLGRNALYGLGAGGPDGVRKVFELLKAELDTAMRLLGVQRVDQLGLQHVSA
jgi:isopentenyl diphosphate isomerase/L-lactate dehydrogenase-like FMN-dependent dehydrogenase